MGTAESVRTIGFGAAVAVVLVLLAGCDTPYQKSGLAGGFEETQIAPDAWRVSFTGNGYTSSETVQDYVLLRSAELTLQSGFSYFGLASSSARTNQLGAYATPVTTTTTANAYALGNAAYGTATSTSSGGNVFFVSYPTANNVVVMFKTKPEVQGMIFDAQFVCRSVGGKYKVTCGSAK